VVDNVLPIPHARLLDMMVTEARQREAPVFTLKGSSRDPYLHLVSAVLSSRTRDEVTADAGRQLFARADRPEKLAHMRVEDVEVLIRSVGFYRVKARTLKKLAAMLVNEYHSKVPLSMEELLKLPGVGRKTASIVLSASDIPAIAVDTHVHRISNRLGIVETWKPEETEIELKRVFAQRLWNRLNKAFVGFGQTVCKPVGPLCQECPFTTWCPKIGVSKYGETAGSR